MNIEQITGLAAGLTIACLIVALILMRKRIRELKQEARCTLIDALEKQCETNHHDAVVMACMLVRALGYHIAGIKPGNISRHRRVTLVEIKPAGLVRAQSEPVKGFKVHSRSNPID